MSCEILDELMKLGITSSEAINYFKDYASYLSHGDPQICTFDD